MHINTCDLPLCEMCTGVLPEELNLRCTLSYFPVSALPGHFQMKHSTHALECWGQDSGLLFDVKDRSILDV
jgi:hypothetical protein